MLSPARQPRMQLCSSCDLLSFPGTGSAVRGGHTLGGGLDSGNERRPAQTSGACRGAPGGPGQREAHHRRVFLQGWRRQEHHRCEPGLYSAAGARSETTTHTVTLYTFQWDLSSIPPAARVWLQLLASIWLGCTCLQMIGLQTSGCTCLAARAWLRAGCAIATALMVLQRESAAERVWWWSVQSM